MPHHADIETSAVSHLGKYQIIHGDSEAVCITGMSQNDRQTVGTTSTLTYLQTLKLSRTDGWTEGSRGHGSASSPRGSCPG